MKKEELSALIEQSKDGSQRAFSKLYSEFYRSIYNQIYAIVKNKEIAEDLTLESITKAFIKIHKFSQDISFEMWLKTIATNTTIDFLRRNSKMETINSIDDEDSVMQIADESDNPELNLMHNEHRRIVEKNIGLLGKRARDIAQLRYMSGLSYKEIAEKTGLNIGTVKSYISKSTNKLKPKD